MRKIRIPRILKINRIDGLSVSVGFNNGESRIIDFREVFVDLGVQKSSPEFILFDEQEFAKVKLEEFTLSWDNVEQYISLRNGEKKRVPYEIGADVLLKHSKPEKVVSKTIVLI